MRPKLLVIGKVAGQEPPQMVLVQHDDMIQTRAANTPDESFDVGILPR